MAFDHHAKNQNLHKIVRDELDREFENTIQSEQTDITMVSVAEDTQMMGHATEKDWGE